MSARSLADPRHHCNVPYFSTGCTASVWGSQAWEQPHNRTSFLSVLSTNSEALSLTQGNTRFLRTHRLMPLYASGFLLIHTQVLPGILMRWLELHWEDCITFSTTAGKMAVVLHSCWKPPDHCQEEECKTFPGAAVTSAPHSTSPWSGLSGSSSLQQNHWER